MELNTSRSAKLTVRDDIPIMLVDAAVERARWDEEHKG